MKAIRFFISVVLLAVIAIAAAVNINMDIKENKKANFFSLSNIEALASNENSGNITCMYLGTLECPIEGTMARVMYIIEG